MAKKTSVIICWFALCLMFAIAPVCSLKAQDIQISAEGYSYYIMDDGTIEITGYSGTDASLVIPGAINGREVTSVGERAFAASGSLTGITVSHGIVCIGDGAFADCEKLQTVQIPASIANIGEDVFLNCGSLSGISVDAGNTQYCAKDNLLYDAGQKTLLYCPGDRKSVV